MRNGQSGRAGVAVGGSFRMSCDTSAIETDRKWATKQVRRLNDTHLNRKAKMKNNSR
jgi:hypothetical protein